MTRATITLTYDENKYMFEVLRLVTQQLKEGAQSGFFMLLPFIKLFYRSSQLQ